MGTTSYDYDEDGQTRLKFAPGGTTEYAWDFDGRMVAATTPTESLTFSYDVDGIRWRKTVNGVATHFVVDKNRDFAQVLEERDAAGTIDVLYVYGNDLISQERAATGLRFCHVDGQIRRASSRTAARTSRTRMTRSA